MLKNIPPIAWVIASVSGLIFTSGVSFQAFRSNKLSIKFANFQVDSSVQLSKNLKVSQDLERQVLLLKQKEEAYMQLQRKYVELEKYNQPVELLKDEIEKVNQIEKEINLDTITEEIQETTSEIVSEIEKIEEVGEKNMGTN